MRQEDRLGRRLPRGEPQGRSGSACAQASKTEHRESRQTPEANSPRGFVFYAAIAQ